VRPQEVESPDVARLHDAGFSDDDVWDIGSVVALFALSNRLAHAADIRPNPEFHTLGR
jgi:alkylhydroperoxidase family enzyme